MSWRAQQAAKVLNDGTFRDRVLTSEVTTSCKWGEYAAYVIYDNGEHYLISAGSDIQWPTAYCKSTANSLSSYRPCWVVLLKPYEWELDHLREKHRIKTEQRINWRINQLMG